MSNGSLGRRWLVVGTVLLVAACSKETEGERVDFFAQASGPDDAVAGQVYRFDNSLGYQVALSRARVFIGAVYLSQANPANYQVDLLCRTEGIYSGEVRSSVEVDALSPVPVEFPSGGQGTSRPSQSAEIWLTDRPLSDDTLGQVVLDLEGLATKEGANWPFAAQLTVGKNRETAPKNPALPSSNPPCRQRMVSPVPVDFELAAGGRLHLQVNPKALLANVDFSTLSPDPDRPGQYRFLDKNDGAVQAEVALFQALLSSEETYRISFEKAP